MISRQTTFVSRYQSAAVAIALGAPLLGSAATAQTAPAPWLFSGANASNSSGVTTPSSPRQLNTHTAPNLTLKWSFQPAAGVSATPTVEQGGLYVPDWSGNLYKLDPETGALIWQTTLKTLTGAYGVSRTSPAIGAGGEIIVGDQAAGAPVISVNRATGAPIWKTLLETNPYAEITGSPIVYNGIVYVGVSSWEETYAARDLTYQPSFRGSVVALNEATGAILWRFYTTPVGYTGAAVWGGAPVVYATGKALIFATGNNYSVPTGVATCLAQAGSGVSAQLACMDPQNFVDAIVSVDLKTGKLNWGRPLQGTDIDTVRCYTDPNGCQTPIGPDLDFNQGPALFHNASLAGMPDDRGGVTQAYVLGAAQKSGVYWEINPADGGVISSTFIGHGMVRWGSAVNVSTENSVLVALDNSSHWTNTLTGVNGVQQSWNAGAWGAINIKTGKFLWQIPAYGQDLANPAFGGSAPGAVSYTNNLLFAGSSSGYLAAVDATTGKTCWTFSTGVPIVSAPAIFNDTVYWGTGYRSNAIGTPMIYAFAPKS